jgi:enterochelin esterase-like enzyme
VLSLALAAFLVVGFVGVRRYGENYWLYRGFAPPRDPAFVHRVGTEQELRVASPALGGRSQQVVVYLPPGYDASASARYPVLYLLHGFPGRPLAFLQTVQMGVVQDRFVAQHRAPPAILVMPMGSTGTFTDEEWANGVGASQGWETFVARDLVAAIDARYRTIASGAGRGIAGLSEGGYGAINIAIHHPHEFSVVESWSGYERPAKLRSIFGSQLQLLARNDPRRTLAAAAPALRRGHVYFWFYSGLADSMRGQNRLFAAELARHHVRHRYFQVVGGHNWALWRFEAPAAYLAATSNLAGHA